MLKCNRNKERRTKDRRRDYQRTPEFSINMGKYHIKLWLAFYWKDNSLHKGEEK